MTIHDLQVNQNGENAETSTPGKGLAFWYTTKALGTGILYGAEERYTGLGLLFDSFDDDGKVLLGSECVVWLALGCFVSQS